MFHPKLLGYKPGFFFSCCKVKEGLTLIGVLLRNSDARKKNLGIDREAYFSSLILMVHNMALQGSPQGIWNRRN
jgi:hypothetical protein